MNDIKIIDNSNRYSLLNMYIFSTVNRKIIENVKLSENKIFWKLFRISLNYCIGGAQFQEIRIF